jgi:HD-like signal output (HDOD) protein
MRGEEPRAGAVGFPRCARARRFRSGAVPPIRDDWVSGESGLQRVLFVDDEPQVLDGLRAGLRRQRGAIDLSFAVGAEAGLTALAHARYDVVVSDMRMPAMDGASFLRIVMEQQPEVVRIVLSGYSDRSNVLRALGVAHQFLSKPCPTDTIAEVLFRASALRSLVTDERLRRFMSRLTSLPAERSVSDQLADTLIQPGSSAVSVLRVVEQDLALSAKLLQVVNSSAGGQIKPVGTLDDAIARMDRDTLRALALSSCLSQNAEQSTSMPGLTMARLHEHALLSARIARRLMANTSDGHLAFTTALLANAGKLVLWLWWPERFALVIEACRSGVPPREAEQLLFGFTHAEVGAYLLGLWGLPASSVEAVAFHHDPFPKSRVLTGRPMTGWKTGPGGPQLELVTAVHVACALADEMLQPTPGVTEPAGLEQKSIDQLALWDVLSDWRLIAEEEANLPAAV